MSESRGSTDDQAADRTTLQSRSSPEHLSLSRCAACYNVKSSSVSWRGDDGESSSSAEDSGPEVDDESEAESSSSSSSGNETPEPERSGDAAEDESRGGGGGGRGEDGDETGETSNRREEENKPSSLTPHLIPLSFLPRPPQVVSTLHLQVSPQNCGDDKTFFNIRQRRPEREEEETQERYTGRGRGGGGGSINRLMPQQLPQCQQMMLPWQQRSQPTEQHHHHHHQQQQQQQQQQRHQRPKPRQLSAQGQRLPPPSHTCPPTLCTPLWAPHTHLHALTPQPCWQCHHVHPPNTHYSQ